MANTQILLVEDDGLVAKDIQNTLKKLGYDIFRIVAYGEEAVKVAAEMQPDLVLMDIGLRGDMDGTEAAAYIRDKLNIPVVYITAYGDDTTLGRAEKTKPLGIIIKPCGEKELHKGIELALSRNKLENPSKKRR